VYDPVLLRKGGTSAPPSTFVGAIRQLLVIAKCQENPLFLHGRTATLLSECIEYHGRLSSLTHAGIPTLFLADLGCFRCECQY